MTGSVCAAKRLSAIHEVPGPPSSPRAEPRHDSEWAYSRNAGLSARIRSLLSFGTLDPTARVQASMRRFSS
jgi:hypothetical protein